MPIYEYRCDKCGQKFEKMESFSAKSITECPECHGSAHRLISLGAFVLKGTGWYVTDYKSKQSDSSSSKPSSSKANSTSNASPPANTTPKTEAA